MDSESTQSEASGAPPTGGGGAGAAIGAENGPPIPGKKQANLWALAVVGLYVMALLVETVPLIYTCFFSNKNSPSVGDVIEVFIIPHYWAVIAFLGFSQYILLRVPVRFVAHRPVTRSSLILPLIFSGFWFGCLVLGAGVALAEYGGVIGDPLIYVLIAVPIASWIAWAVVFYRFSRTQSPNDIIQQKCRILIRGSILELLIAVPTHVAARMRTDCCAGFGTFFGITMGVSVMLMAFGPAVYFLFVERWRRKKGTLNEGECSAPIAPPGEKDPFKRD